MPRRTSHAIAPRHRTRHALPSRAGHAPGFAPERLEPRQLMATIAWDGDAGDGNFTNPLNWAGDIMPGFEDDAVITPGAGPFIELRAGDTVSLKSLVVDWPLAINGTLGVSDQATIGDNFFDIGATGRLETNNLTLEASIGAVSNIGEWTIGGTSLIDRRIVSEGALLIGQSATITLGIGLNVALQLGSIDVTGGTMTVREGASITGAGRALDQLRIATVLNVDGGAMLANVGLNADGSSLGDNVRVNFGQSLTSTLTDSRLRFDYALVTGLFDAAQTDVEINGRAIIYGQATIEGGNLRMRGLLLARAPLANPTQPSSLLITSAQIVMDGIFGRPNRLFGAIEIQDSECSVSSVFHFGNGVTLRGVELTGTDGLGRPSWWFIEGSVTASDLSTAGNVLLRMDQDATLTLDGGTNQFGTQIIVGGAINWTDGDLTIITVGGGSNERSRIGGAIRGVFTGPGSHRLDLIGDERYRHLVLGGTLSFSFDDPAGQVVVNGTLSNQGTVEVTGGILRYETGLIGFNGGKFGSRYGAWIVGPDAILDIVEPVTQSHGWLTIIGTGQVPALAAMTLNTGTITLEGAGGWLAANPVALRNYGTIRKAGEGERIVPAAITNLVHGTIAVDSGHLTIDSELLINRGTLAIGSDQFMSPRAVFRTTGDYREGGHALLRIIGAADGDPDDLPRFGVGGTMSLAGEVVVSLTTSTPFPQTSSWQLGYSSTRRVGEFRSTQVTLPGAQGSLVYSGQRFLVMIEV